MGQISPVISLDSLCCRTSSYLRSRFQTPVLPSHLLQGTEGWGSVSGLIPDSKEGAGPQKKGPGVRGFCLGAVGNSFWYPVGTGERMF